MKETRPDIVREIRVPNAPGLETRAEAFKVMAHVAAPQDEEGQGALMVEEEADRLVLSRVSKSSVFGLNFFPGFWTRLK